jgi:hypothetical protein
MIQQATATLASIFTNKFVVKAIKPTLKLAIVDITGAMTFALDHFDDMRGNVIGISNATTSDETEVTLVVTSPDGLTSFNVPLVTFKTGATLLETFNSRPEWVGYTIAGDGIAFGTSIVSFTARRPVSSGAISLSQTGASLTLRQKTQVRIDMASLGIAWEEGAAYTFEVSEGFVVDTDSDTNFTNPAQNISYTANPALAISSSSPSDGDTGTEVNDYIEINFNRSVSPYIGQNFYFYQSVGGTDTLLKTIPVTTGIINRNKITLDVRGSMKEATTYYLLSDEEIVKDADNFVFNGISDAQTLRFTSAVAEQFRGFIALIMTIGGVTARIGVRKQYTAAIASAANFTVGTTIRSTLSAAISSAFAVSKANMGKLKTASSTMSAVATLRADPYDAVLAASTTMSITGKRVRYFSPATYTSQFTPYVLNTDYFVINALTDDLTATNVLFGDALDADHGDLIIAKGSNNSATYIFGKSGSTWSQEAKVVSANAVGIVYKGNTTANPDLAVMAGSDAIEVYTRSGGSWSLDQTLTSPVTDAGAYGHYIRKDVTSTDDQIFHLVSSSGKAYILSYDDQVTSGTYVWTSHYLDLTGWSSEVHLTDNDSFVGKHVYQSSAGAFWYFTTPGNNYITLVGLAYQYDFGQNTASPYGSGQSINIPYTTGNFNGAVLAMTYSAANKWILAAGLYKHNQTNANAGVVKLYHATNVGSSGMSEIYSLQAPTPTVGDEFGRSIDVNDDYLVIGAPGVGGGAVYVYKRSGTTFTFDTVLRPEFPISGMRFGETVKVTVDGSITVGAPKLNNSTGLVDSTGTVFVYKRIIT